MRCREARRRFHLAGAAQGHAAADEPLVASHLAGCVACAAWARNEARITAGLAALGAATPFELDVVARVVADIDTLATRGARARSGRLPAWATAAALALALGMLTDVVGQAGHLWGGVRSVWTLSSGMASAGETLGPAAATVLGALYDVAAPLAGGALLVLRAIQPVVVAGVLLGGIAMLLTLAVVVRRDAQRSAWSAGGRSRP